MSFAHSPSGEITEVNLSYLRMAQRLLREDRASAMKCLGITEQVANVLENLSIAQTAKLAASTQLMLRFRFDAHTILSALGSTEKSMVTATSRTETSGAALVVRTPD